jgi:hypothetical protein
MLSFTGATGPTGPASDPSDGIIPLTFQNGVFPYIGYAGCVDSYVSSASPAANYEDGGLQVGQSASTSTRTFIKFDISAITPNTAVVKAAYLSFGNSYCQNSIQKIAAYKVTSFRDNALTWNTFNGANIWSTAGGQFDAIANSDIAEIAVDSNEVVLKPDNALVQNWVVNSLENNGVVIIGQNEGAAIYGTYHNYDSATASIDYRPKLTVFYKKK